MRLPWHLQRRSKYYIVSRNAAQPNKRFHCLNHRRVSLVEDQDLSIIIEKQQAAGELRGGGGVWRGKRAGSMFSSALRQIYHHGPLRPYICFLVYRYIRFKSHLQSSKQIKQHGLTIA